MRNCQNSDSLRKVLLTDNSNPPLQDSDKLVEVIIAASGKALLLTKTQEVATKIITQLTAKSLKEAPGIDVSGVYIEFDWSNPIQEAIKKVYRQFEIVNSSLFSPQFRFLKLPIISS